MEPLMHYQAGPAGEGWVAKVPPARSVLSEAVAAKPPAAKMTNGELSAFPESIVMSKEERTWLTAAVKNVKTISLRNKTEGARVNGFYVRMIDATIMFATLRFHNLPSAIASDIIMGGLYFDKSKSKKRAIRLWTKMVSVNNLEWVRWPNL
jgi:hypothetical protein